MRRVGSATGIRLWTAQGSPSAPFQVQINDGTNTSTATVMITVNPQNDGPTAGNDSISTIEDNVPRFIKSRHAVPFPRIEAEEGRAAESYEHLLSVQSRGGVAYAVASVHLARAVFELAPEAFRSQTALPMLSKLDVGIARARQTLVIGGADPETATLLKIALGAPTAEARCVVTGDDNVVIYVGEIVYRGDCVKLDGDLLAGLTHA